MKTVSKIKRKGFPTSSKYYESSHAEADIDEKKKYPKGYEKLKKIERKIDKGELLGKNTKSGKVYISKKVPKKLREEVKFHEMDENKRIRDRKKK